MMLGISNNTSSFPDLSFLFNFTNFIYVILAIFLFIVAFFAWMLKGSKEAKLERFFLKVGKEIEKWVPEDGYEKPKLILINLTHSNYATLRRFIRTIGKRIKGLFRKIPTIIFVNDNDSEVDTQVFLIKEATSYLAGKEIMDNELLISIRVYFAYKYVLQNRTELINGVYDKIAHEFDNCKYKEIILNFDDFAFSKNILKTYYMEEAQLGDFTLLKYVILPMIKERAKEIKDYIKQSKIISDEQKEFLDIITKLSKKEYFVLFIGLKETGNYCDMIRNELRNRNIIGLILEARGKYLGKLRSVSTTCCSSNNLKDIKEITGIWKSSDKEWKEKEVVWIILERIR